jgi:DNA-binding beta-propeller fold protein YncE
MAVAAMPAFAADQVYWSNGMANTISFANLDGSGGGGELSTTGAPAHVVLGLGIVPSAGRLYWVNDSPGSIAVANLDGSGGSQLNTSGATLGGPGGAAVDPATGKIFWSNEASKTISFANLDGSGGGGDLNTTGAPAPSDPTGVAIDPVGGRIYFADSVNNTISYANLDGSGAGQLNVGGATIDGIQGLAIDDTRRRIYWANENDNDIWSANLDGSGAVSLNLSGATPDGPAGIAIDPAAGRLYWTNFNGPSGGGPAISYAALDGSGGGDLGTAGATPELPNFLALLKAPSGTGSPTIAGASVPGSTLSCSQGTWAPDLVGSFLSQAPASIAYSWTLNGSPVAGATASTLTAGAPGQYACRVAATNHAGAATQTSPVHTVLGAPASTNLPSVTGRLKAGQKLTCTPGSWTNAPASFTYSWRRDGTPIIGASSSTYKVQTIDQGNSLTCTVTASNGGTPTSATSRGVKVPVPHVARCPAATGTLSGDKLGLLKLGDTRTQTKRVYKHSSDRDRAYEDFFCLTPIGIRVGYASPKLLATLPTHKRRAYTNRVIWISTASAFYAVAGIRPGATVATAQAGLRLGKAFGIGLNDWYLAPAGRATAVLKVRHGVVEEIGIGETSLTHGRTAQRAFLTSFR